MNLPTTNLLEWIDKRADAIAKQQGTTNPYEMTDVNSLVEYRVLMELELRILQERENEKAVIVHSYSVGVADYLDKRTDCYRYYQTTFSPNKDER